jgi:hypothetical protein
MARPPGGGHSLEGGDQFGHGVVSQDGGLGTWLRGQVRAGDGDVADLAGGDLDLTTADVPRQVCQADQGQNPPVKRMAGVGDGDLALAHFGDQRCITLAGVSPSPRAG